MNLRHLQAIVTFQQPPAWVADELDTEAQRIANHFDLPLAEVITTTEETS